MPEAILLQDVEQLGAKGTVVDVSKGYLRNFLIPRKLAQPATKGARRGRPPRRRGRGARRRATATSQRPGERRAAQQDGPHDRPPGRRGRPPVRLGHRPRTSPTRSSEARGLDVDRRKVHLEEPIKHVGTYMVVVEVADGVTATVKTMVVRALARPPGRARCPDAPAQARPSSWPTVLGGRRGPRDIPASTGNASATALRQLRKERQGRLRDGRAERYGRPAPMSTATPTHGNGNGNGGPPVRRPAWAPRRTRSRPSSRSSARSCSPTRALRVRHRGGPAARGLLPRAPPHDLRVDARRSTRPASRSTSSRSPSTCARAASSRRPAAPAEIDACGRRPRGRQPAPLRRRSSRSTRSCAGCSTRPTRSRPRVHGHEAQPRELVERAERAILEVAHDDRQKDFRKVGDVLHVEIDKWQELSAEGRSLTGTPSGFADLDDDHRRLPARQPDHHRRAPVDGEVGPRHEHRRERRARPRATAARRAVHPRDVRGRARPALHRLARRRSRATTCARAGSRTSASGSASCSVAGEYDAAPLFVDDSLGHRHPRRPRQGAPAAPAELADHGGLGLIIVDYLQLMRADARIENRVQQVGEMSPRAEDPRPRARSRSSRSRSSRAASSRARTSGRCSPTCASPGRSSRTPTS